MVRISIRLVLSLSLLLILQSTGFAQTRMPQLKFTERTLQNGLRVLSAADPSSPTVAIQVWYHVGSKDDPDKRSGFAHLFEHIMFKATRNMLSETLDRLTEDVGGFNNASTNDDFTNYYEVVPANHLERVLWAEADRMGGRLGLGTSGVVERVHPQFGSTNRDGLLGNGPPCCRCERLVCRRHVGRHR